MVVVDGDGVGDGGGDADDDDGVCSRGVSSPDGPPDRALYIGVVEGGRRASLQNG